MRLSTEEVQAIITSFQATYGAEDHIWLFGSRTDDQKKGGDIDLYIETNLAMGEATEAEYQFLHLLETEIGEQKIDIVLNILQLNQKVPLFNIARKGILIR